MIFSYKKSKINFIGAISSYAILFLATATTAFALNSSASTQTLTQEQVTTIINQSHLNRSFHVTATPEVVNELNNIRSSEQARTYMQAALKRMAEYKPYIQNELKKGSLPTDLLALPLVESGYQPLDESKNPVLAAGVWQIVPTTGKRLGLSVDKNNDERLNTQLATKAAITYLNSLYSQFHDWKLATIAYEIGEDRTEALIKTTTSRDAWTLAQTSSAPESLKKFLAQFDATLIIMHNPSLID